MLLKRKDVPIDKTDKVIGRIGLTEWFANIQFKIIPSSNFKLKRTPLHYAAETNLESAITLLSYDKQLLKSVDIVNSSFLNKA